MSMTFEQMQEVLSQMTQANLGLYERQNRIEREMSETRAIVDRTSDNLSRIEAIVESNARAIQATANKLDEKFDLIGDAVLKNQEMIMKLDRRDRKQQAEIKGLRLETRRILERWLGEAFPDDPDLEDEPE
jgi:hypothetical protein